ncbi:MAG: hypothetical protein QM791_03385 [Ferruginibacter sp.]
MTGNDNLAQPPEKVNPFLSYTGKTIRSVRVVVLGFEKDIYDTLKLKRGFGIGVANALHKNTTQQTAENHLFFKAGEHINPYLLSDNERYLRDQIFIQDAMILVNKVAEASDSVDLTVLIKDVFSLGGGIGISNAKKYRFEVKEENLGGRGTKIAVNTLYDDARVPKFGFGAELLKRNIRGSFINWSIGLQNYRNAFNSGRSEENIYYMHFEKPLVSQYLQWMGALDLSYNRTSNNYLVDSVYQRDYKYSYYNADGWIAYNFGSKKLMYQNLKSTARKFVAFRAFKQHFIRVPDKNLTSFDASYSDISGVLGSFSIFKQNFYRATYIYGFGRNEDVPEGFSGSLVGGYTMKQDSLHNTSRSRPYFGFDGQYSAYGKKGLYSAYTFRFGGYKYKGRWEDVALLLNMEYFTKLKELRPNWYRRFFFGGGITRQFSPVLDPALLLRSSFGLPYFDYGYVASDFRATVKSEVVFYHTRKFWGFRFAPFAFGDMAVLKPTNESFSKSELFSAVGAGLRTRNENLIFGTIEMRCYYFPRTLPTMNHFKIKFNTNLRFRYNSSFIRRPDFVTPN